MKVLAKNGNNAILFIPLCESVAERSNFLYHLYLKQILLFSRLLNINFFLYKLVNFHLQNLIFRAEIRFLSTPIRLGDIQKTGLVHLKNFQ